jgi:adenylate cyclase
MRALRLLHRHEKTLYPSLTLATIAKYFDAEVEPINSQIHPGERLGGVYAGDREIPTNGRGHFYLNYYMDPQEYFEAYSVADFIDGTVPPEKYEDKIVLFGMTAHGLKQDLRATPYSPATPGVYVHATAIQNIIDQRYLERVFGIALAEIFFYLVLGVALGLLLPRIPAWAGVLVAVGFAVGLYLIDVLWLFPNGTWIMTVFPTLQVATTLVGVIVHGYLTEGREKAKIRKAFQFYLTKSVVDEMLKDAAKLQLGGERRVCTVLFSDIRGFTTISERLSPEELVSLLNSYLTPMTNLVFKYDGTLDKYMGDAIMAIFGAPVPYEDHAERACFSALEMMEELEKLQAGWRRDQLPEIDIGIGLNTGPMSVGNMGSEIRFDYTVMGDNVNLGSRLEGINKQYGTNIIVSESTQTAATGVHTREMDAVRVKGKREPVRIYELLGKGKPDASAKALIETFHSGIAAYKAQQWDQAIALFDQVRTDLKPNDFASTMYIERCEVYRAQPPGPEWDGVFTMKTK